MSEELHERLATPPLLSATSKTKPLPIGKGLAWLRSLAKSMLRPSVTVLWPLPPQLSQARLLSILRRAEIMLRAGYSIRVIPMQCEAQGARCRNSALRLEMPQELRVCQTQEPEVAESMRNASHREHLQVPLSVVGSPLSSCGESPNEPKLSDGGAWRGSCEGGAQKEATDVGQRHERTGRVRARIAATVTRGAVRCSAWLGDVRSIPEDMAGKILMDDDANGNAGIHGSVETIQAGLNNQPRILRWSVEADRKSTRLNSSHHAISRMPSSA